METSDQKRGRIQPDMIYKHPVEIVLNILEIVFEPNPLGREINVCRKKKNHAQVAGASGQIIIGSKRIHGSQHHQNADQNRAHSYRSMTKER